MWVYSMGLTGHWCQSIKKSILWAFPQIHHNVMEHSEMWHPPRFFLRCTFFWPYTIMLHTVFHCHHVAKTYVSPFLRRLRCHLDGKGYWKKQPVPTLLLLKNNIYCFASVCCFPHFFLQHILCLLSYCLILNSSKKQQLFVPNPSTFSVIYFAYYVKLHPTSYYNMVFIQLSVTDLFCIFFASPSISRIIIYKICVKNVGPS